MMEGSDPLGQNQSGFLSQLEMELKEEVSKERIPDRRTAMDQGQKSLRRTTEVKTDARVAGVLGTGTRVVPARCK